MGQKEDSEDDEFEFLSQSPEAKSPTQLEPKEINIPIQIEEKLDNNESNNENQRGEPSKNPPSKEAQQSGKNGATVQIVQEQDSVRPKEVIGVAKHKDPKIQVA